MRLQTNQLLIIHTPTPQKLRLAITGCTGGDGDGCGSTGTGEGCLEFPLFVVAFPEVCGAAFDYYGEEFVGSVAIAPGYHSLVTDLGLEGWREGGAGWVV